MKLKALALVVGALIWGVVGTPAPAVGQDDPPKREARALDGTWQVVAQRTDGKDDAIPRDGGDMVVIAGGKYTMKQGDREVGKGTFTIDPTKTPKTVDNAMTDGESKGKTALGIYEVKGEELKVAWSRPGEPDRPTRFDGKSYRVTTLKRVKP
jgi:uncharacterized protein (TIGR03067 family)